MFIKIKRKIPKRNSILTYDVMDIAIHIVKYCNSKNRPINNLTLQKLLYFVQAYFMTQTYEKQPLFKADFVAWEFGPACPLAYYELQYYDGHLASIFEEYSILTNNKLYKYNSNSISTNDQTLINAVLDYYLNYSSADLIKLSQNQDPWQNTKKTAVISEQSMVKYFSKNPQPIFLS